MSTRDFTFSGLLTAAADPLAQVTSSTTTITASTTTNSPDCIWSDAVCNKNSFSNAPKRQQQQPVRFQALQKLQQHTETSTTPTTTTTTHSANEFQLTPRIPLNSSLTLHTTSCILGFDSDATNSSASSSSCTINTSSNSLQGSLGGLLERDNNIKSQKLATNRQQQQQSEHLLELQREIKEDADEIFADINSLINNRSSLYSNIDDFDIDDENIVRALPSDTPTSQTRHSHQQNHQQQQPNQNNKAVNLSPRIVTSTTTIATPNTTTNLTSPTNSHSHLGGSSQSHHQHQHHNSSSNNSLRLQTSVSQFHSPTITTTSTTNNTPTSADTPNLQSDETLFTTDNDQDFFDDYPPPNHRTASIRDDDADLLTKRDCGQIVGANKSSQQSRIHQSTYSSSRLMPVVKYKQQQQQSSMIDAMQHDNSTDGEYRLSSNQGDDEDDEVMCRSMTTADRYLCLEGRSNDISVQDDDVVKQQHKPEDDEDEVNDIRFGDEHGFNPCNRFPGQQQQLQQNYQDVQKVIQQVTNNLPKPCVFFLEGNCRRSDCKYSHDLSSITCKYWIEGFCFKGEMCPFSHSYTPVDSQNMLDSEEDGLDSLSKRELNPTFVIESETDFPSLPLDAPNSAPLSDNTQGNIKANALSKNLKSRILGSNPAVVFKTVKKKRRKG